ncbi:E3 ubiquitin-protein ligase RNF181-like [Gigantopelta aegis]|uniref:E3 ubiquitin-protein ligase RNF181-like n=1 Tax=Gigantopelta aegis TaxID=1735272 RepID=UPI001B88DB3A|nr:E3 ubiquitin-protein ligase RNF181-like [Gigantopelta aegis]
MASYYDEHDCEPLANGETPNHLLHLARLLLDTGAAMEWNVEYDRIFGGTRKVPPASKKFVDELPTKLISPTIAAQGIQCSVCLGEFDEEDETKTLPCDHQFHSKCILPWLQKVSTCPVCRCELPTDDPDYEMYKQHKARAKQREYELETLHCSMFG